MTDPGPLPELAWLPVDKLDVDPEYQRSIEGWASQKLIDKIAAEWDWRKTGALICAPKGEDRYWVVDGQHRMAAARKRGGIPHLPAVVHRGLALAELAGAFVGANKDRVTMSVQSLFRARLVAGDVDAATVKRLCDANGIAIEPHNKAVRQLGASHTAAVSSLLVILREKGEVILGGAVNAAAEAWRHTPAALSGVVFRAAAIYLAEGGTIADCATAMRRVGLKPIWEFNRLGTTQGARQLADALKRALPAPQAQISPAPKSVTGEAQPSGNGKALSQRSVGSERAAASPVTMGGGRHTAVGPKATVSAEEIADFLRQHGRKASIIGKAWQRKAFLDGEEVSIEALYAAANKLRAAAGLSEVRAA